MKTNIVETKELNIFEICTTDGYETWSSYKFDDMESVRYYLKKFIFENILDGVYEHFFWENDEKQSGEGVPTPLSRKEFDKRMLEEGSKEYHYFKYELNKSEAYKFVDTRTHIYDSDENRDFIDKLCKKINSENIINSGDTIYFQASKVIRVRPR